MNINITGHKTTITMSLKDSIESKLKKIARHFPDIDRIDVIAKIDGPDHIVEANLLYKGHQISATSKTNDMYDSIAEIPAKLESSLSTIKTSLLSSRKKNSVEIE